MKKKWSDIKKLLKTDFIQVLIFNIMSKGLSLILTVCFIRLLTVNEYSILVRFQSISSLMYGIFGCGISMALVRYITEEFSRGNDNTHELYVESILLQIAIFGIIGLFFKVVASVYNIGNKVAIISILFGFLISMIQINQSWFQAKEKYVLSGLVDVIRPVFITIYLFFLLFILRIQININNTFNVYIVSGVIAFFLGLILIISNSKKFIFKFNKYNMSQLIATSIWLIIYCILLNLLNQMDVIMLSQLTTERDVSMYGVAFRYYNILLALLQPIMTVLRVRSSKIEYTESALKRREFTLNWIKTASVPVFLICLTGIIVCSPIMKILNGSNYNDSIFALKIFIIGAGFSYIFAANVTMVMAAKKYGQLCVIAFIALLFNMISNFLLIPRFGINGAAIATVLSQILLNVSATCVIIRDKRGS